MPHFMSELAVRLVDSAYRIHSDNTDWLRFPVPDDVRAEVQAALSNFTHFAANRDLHFKTADEHRQSIEMIGWVRELADGLEATYQLLADDYSRRMLVDVMAFRVLGDRQVKLGRNDATYQACVAALPSLVKTARTVPVTLLDGWLNRYDLRPLRFPIEADLHPLNVLYTYQLQQYRYDHDGNVVEAAAGDFAIDGGGCWGDTALYLAQKIGPTGRVYCFEFSPDNLPTLKRNLTLNPALAPAIRLTPNALWSNSGTELSFNPAGPGTHVGEAGQSRVTTLCIDDLATREKLPRLNFIKMDIEGAELEALRGAEKTIRAHKPKLAVTLYHRLQDFATIPRWLHELNLGYRFFLDHFSINQEETVLFATPN